MNNSIFLLFLLGLATAANSSIRGEVIDSQTGQYLIGANIMLDGTILGSASNENGHYIIPSVPIGSYTLRALFIGYENLEKKIRVEGNQSYVIDITLTPSAIELDETKVTAEKRKGKVTGAPASMEIITSRDIKGKTTTNMGAYLKGLKGIDFTSSGINNYSISVRGFNSSFNTRLLTLSDGRVANIPALRVINYSTIPQSMDDVEKIEVILGPATALYGANAHSGVVNIISKAPSQTEGLSMSLSGSSDERQMRKINGRFAKKLSNSLSIKFSGMYLHAYDWPFISEEEYKAHLYPWTLTPGRTIDGKDNNPWNTRGEPYDSSYSAITQKWYIVGNGEQMDTGDPDGDGVMGEDWFNGYDDDGDASDSDGDGWCDGQELQWAIEHGKLDERGWNDDTNTPTEPIENFSNWIDEDYFIANGIDDDQDGIIDENIDNIQDYGFDGVDNDNNGIIDDESGSSLQATIKSWGARIENNILISKGRRDSLKSDGKINPYYIPDLNWLNLDLLGKHRFNEDEVKLEFDIFYYDFGQDGKPGDPYLDVAGDTEFQMGECLTFFGGFVPYSDCDCGLDGILSIDLNNDNVYDLEGEIEPDFGENDGQWQPGEGWIDDGDEVVDLGLFNDPQDSYVCPCGLIEGTFTCAPYSDTCDYGDDVWPPKNGSWDIGEEIYDCGQDGLCPGDNGYIMADPGEGDGKLAYDNLEKDGIFDTGDNLYGFAGEQFSDDNENGIRDPYETYTDTNNDGLYNPPDLLDNYQFVADHNGDGLSDYPDFEIDNRKVEVRIDYDPNNDFNMTFQFGYSLTKTQQVTGTSRYIADGFEYKFYQFRSRYKNWFSQFYMNQSFSGKTRGYNLGNRIIDTSKNYAFQIQNNLDFSSFNTKFVWGMDFFRTVPSTNGTILNDGPNGYDNDGDNIYVMNDGIDSDNDGAIDDLICPDGIGEGFRNNKYHQCGEGIDEPDEYDDPTSNEYGVYYQSTTELFGTSRYEFISAARFDYHDLLDEGILFAPKLGFIYRPDEKSSLRFTYGKAHNTPNSITLFTDLFIGSVSIFEIYFRGNKDGTPYCRVGSTCLGKDYPTSVASPGFYSEDGSTFYNMGTADDPNYFDNYEERVYDAPYYFKFPVDQSIIGGDMTPLDTAHFLIFVPELNGEGVLYTPEESINISDVDPIKTEKIQTWEFGYKGFLGSKTHFTLDYYLSFYEDFFSPPTIITPWVVQRIFDDDDKDITTIDNTSIQGIMTINDFGTHPPYGTAWNGMDDDDDWELWSGDIINTGVFNKEGDEIIGDGFNWLDDKDGDGNNADPGEWGFLVWEKDVGQVESDICWPDCYTSYSIYHPHEVLKEKNGLPTWDGAAGSVLDAADGKYVAVGIDEWHETVGLAEYEPVQTGLIDGSGEPIIGWGNADAPYHVVLSPMNYGEVWMQGCDVGITHFVSDKIIIDGNISWYGTTEFYNELTKKNDPINAPEWKWNASVKGNSSLGDLIINFRHVDKFKWSDGIWSGFIGPYDIVDLYYTFHITKNLDFNISLLNLNNDLHKELVGGAIMGRQMVMRFTSTF